MERTSKWIAPGWYAAFCLECFPDGVPFRDKSIRDEFAHEHKQQTSHYVDCINGEVDEN